MIKRLNKIGVVIFVILINIFAKNILYSQESAEQANIFLNFEKATLSSVVNYLTEAKKINLIPNKALDNLPVSLTTREPLTLDKAWNILLTLLEVNGYSIINVDNVFRIVTKAANKQEPLPMYSGLEPELLPDTDEVIRYIYFLKNIKADTVASFLQSMLEGTVQPNTNLDALVITDRCLHIKAAMKIIKELDQGGLRESIKVVKLKHTVSADIVKIFDQIVPKDQQKNLRFLTPGGDKKQMTYFSQDTKIIEEPRQNALILLGQEKNLNRIIDFVKTYIDIPTESAESRLHIKELKYAKAEEVGKLLETIRKPPTGLPKTAQVGEYKFFEDVIIATDTFTEEQAKEGKGGGNRLIISCGKDDWKRFVKLIDSIDKPSPQVAFEVMIVDVNINNEAELKAQFKPKNHGMFGKHINPYFETAIADKTIDLIGTGGISATDLAKVPPVFRRADSDGYSGSHITFGQPSSLWGAIKAILYRNNNNIIIEPYITTNNNQECLIKNEETRYVDGAFSETNLAGSLVRKKELITAPVEVKLTPKVNLDGSINLKVFVNFANFDETSSSSPDEHSRLIDTRVTIGTGEVLVLGGFTKSSHEQKTYKVPVLGDIPIIGNLFKSKTQNKTKTNLYVFIRPSIIKPKIDGTPDEYTQMKVDFAKHQIFEHDTFTSDKDPIQRWFFKPAKQSVSQKIKDAKAGVFRPIDNYATGYNEPMDVDMQNDTYYRAEKELSNKKLTKNISPNKYTKNESFINYAQQNQNIQEDKGQEDIKREKIKARNGRAKKSRLRA